MITLTQIPENFSFREKNHEIYFHVCLFIHIAVIHPARGNSKADDEEEAILNVIKHSYGQAIHVKFDETSIMKEFHPEFTMLAKTDEGIIHESIANWTARMKETSDPNTASIFFPPLHPELLMTCHYSR